jgi:hypothetical protein
LGLDQGQPMLGNTWFVQLGPDLVWAAGNFAAEAPWLLAVSGRDGQVRWYARPGLAPFSLPGTSRPRITIPCAPVVADVDGDGFPDLLVVLRTMFLGRLKMAAAQCAPIFIGFQTIKLLIEMYEMTDRAAARNPAPHNISVLMLTRHVIECIDGASVLVAKGCVSVCDLPMRSAFEAMLGVQYILKTDSKRRGLAYQVQHAHEQKINLHQRCDPNYDAGEAARQAMKDDLFASDILDIIPLGEIQRVAQGLERMLKEPIEKAWKEAKKKKSDNWFSLFDGPPTIKLLAIQLKFGAFYEVLYRRWSRMTHAAGAFSNLGKGKDNRPAIRPIRHPEGIENVSNIAGAIGLFVANRLREVYAPLEQHTFAVKYKSIQRKRSQLMGDKGTVEVVCNSGPCRAHAH